MGGAQKERPASPSCIEAGSEAQALRGVRRLYEKPLRNIDDDDARAAIVARRSKVKRAVSRVVIGISRQC